MIKNTKSTYHRAFKQNFTIPLSDEECRKILKRIIQKYGKRQYSKSLKIRYPNFYKYIDTRYSELAGHKFAEKCYWLINDLTCFPKCKMCGKPVTKFIDFVKGYCDCCSMSCGNKYKLAKIISERKFEISVENDLKYRKQIIDLNLNFHRQTYISHLIQHAPNALNYAAFRYSHLENSGIAEKLYWFINDLKEFPKCVVCGKEIHTFRNIIIGYSQHCQEHMMQDETVRNSISRSYRLHIEKDPDFLNRIRSKRITTNIANNKPPTWNNSEKAKDTFNRNWIQTGKIDDKTKRTKETLKKRYGDETYNNSDLRRKTCLELYGVPSYSQTDEFIEKVKTTNHENLGVDFPGQSPKCREKQMKTCMDRYGVQNYAQSEEFKKLWKDQNFVKNRQLKQYKTKNKNGTFNTSKSEIYVNTILMQKFGKNNVISQYTDKRYPYMCDFYIKHLDIFIECNFHWTHGGHWFDKNSDYDINKLNTWKTKNTKFYNTAIDVWTRRDVMKYNTAKNNNLNYIVFWNLTEFNNWINER